MRDRALRTFRVLAEVEGRMHGMDPDEVEFHEVGAVDAIVDVVGACAALEVLGIDRIVCSPITVGQGRVQAAHGDLPNPAPAVLDLLALRQAPSRGIADHRELATPTGVALMVALADEFGPMPAMAVHSVGYGAGTRDIPGRPNVVQVVIGEAAVSSHRARSAGAAARVQRRRRDRRGARAHDRPPARRRRPRRVGHPDRDEEGPAGAHRARPVRRLTRRRDPHGDGRRDRHARRARHRRCTGGRSSEPTVPSSVDGHTVRVKLAAGRVKVEHDDAAAAAAALGLPLRVVMDRVVALAGDQPEIADSQPSASSTNA